jgi:tRNA (cmo5U34)-methyltransferase
VACSEPPPSGPGTRGQGGGPIHARWDPDTYLDWVRREQPAYDRLQDELVAASRGLSPKRVLDLGCGTGETSLRLVELYPGVELTVLDASEKMLVAARTTLASWSPIVVLAQLEDPLPPGPFDLIVSALAIHHLGSGDKQALFRSVASSLVPGGRFVLADVVIPDDPADARSELSEFDHPSTIADQLAWLSAAGLEPTLHWAHEDLAVLSADRPLE